MYIGTLWFEKMLLNNTYTYVYVMNKYNSIFFYFFTNGYFLQLSKFLDYLGQTKISDVTVVVENIFDGKNPLIKLLFGFSRISDKTFEQKWSKIKQPQ
jgi:hypothetical protein